MTTPGVGTQVKTPVGDAPVVPVILLGTGMYLAWFGVHYWRSDMRWPTDPVKAVLQGKGLPTPQQTPTAAQASLAAQLQLATAAGGVTPSTGQAQPNALGQAVASGTGAPSSNENLGKMLAAAYGWTGNEWDCLRAGWQEESGWRTDAANVPTDPYNHAYGIPQANPGSKMASAGPDWKTNPATQIKWGLSYIRSTYGSPSRVPHWSPSGPTAGYVGY
jgi:hypothetical protein